MTVTIPNSVSALKSKFILNEGITNGAFILCSNLEKILLPSSIIDIGEDAFTYCTKLKGDTIYRDCYYIGNDINPYLIFSGVANYQIENIIMHEDCKYFKGGSFDENCVNIKSIMFSNSISRLGAQSSCPSILTELVLPENLQYLGDMSLFGLVIPHLVLPDTLLNIGTQTFTQTTIETVVIPSSVETIGTFAVSASSENFKIFCEASSKPSGWDSNWNPDNRPVYWAGDWHYDGQGIPVID